MVNKVNDDTGYVRQPLESVIGMKITAVHFDKKGYCILTLDEGKQALTVDADELFDKAGFFFDVATIPFQV